MAETSHTSENWTNDDIRKLIRLWRVIASPILIGVIMGRSKSSILTRAVEVGLTRVPVHGSTRKKWAASEKEEVSTYFYNAITSGKKIDILEYSKKMLRSPDSILNFISNDAGYSLEQIQSVITLPDIDKIISTPPAKVNSASERCCIKCSTPFWSEWSGNRVCQSCTNTEEWRELS